jgi:hypothetical protein
MKKRIAGRERKKVLPIDLPRREREMRREMRNCPSNSAHEKPERERER